MSQELTGKVALVTGASRGIGKACAIALAQRGASIVLNYVANQDAAEATKTELESLGAKVLIVQGNVSIEDEARALVTAAETEFGQVDILVNNAGVNRDKTVQRLTGDAWREVIDTNLSSCFYTTNAVLDGMRERSFGRIIQISSIIGQMGNIGQSNYAASKAGMIAFTKSTAKEVARFGITVNAVCPGFVETDMVAALPDEIKQTLLSNIPLGRFGTAEEVGETVAFLCGPNGGWYTGSQLTMNGGQYM
ncbi:MAG: 3-oxoacyl-ACP reductase family protein [Chloroflexota bacterium]|nr:3-oxoacyl-ACP reductase family protein [Chloroflexota bacterium]